MWFEWIELFCTLINYYLHCIFACKSYFVLICLFHLTTGYISHR